VKRSKSIGRKRRIGSRGKDKGGHVKKCRIKPYDEGITK
jgi:hypothetical protein